MLNNEWHIIFYIFAAEFLYSKYGLDFDRNFNFIVLIFFSQILRRLTNNELYRSTSDEFFFKNEIKNCDNYQVYFFIIKSKLWYRNLPTFLRFIVQRFYLKNSKCFGKCQHFHFISKLIQRNIELILTRRFRSHLWTMNLYILIVTHIQNLFVAEKNIYNSRNAHKTPLFKHKKQFALHDIDAFWII